MKELIAAFTFFTRIPFWRLCAVPPDSFKRIGAYWPFTGWLTGGVTAGVYGLASLAFPPEASMLLALGSRVWLTGGLHEDGLADFADGMGGGRTRQQVLEMMKDSSTGTYGLLALIFYMALRVALTASLAGSREVVCLVLFAADVWGKWNASQIINWLPYARKADESKSKTAYERMSTAAYWAGFLAGLWPIAGIVVWGVMDDSRRQLPWLAVAAAMASLLTARWLAMYMKRRIGGYTGDCCGATFLLCELSFWFIWCGLWKLF
jgi:adenosylcobinamide-GDP ribazoletransferase